MSQILTLNGGGGGGGTAVTKIQGDVGGPVSPTGGGTIDLFGGVGILVTGNPGAHTLTVSSTGTAVFDYTFVNASPYVVIATDQFLGVDSSGGAITIELPTAPTLGRAYQVKDITGSAPVNNITVTTVGGAINIDNAPTFIMNTAYESINVLFNGINYLIF